MHAALAPPTGLATDRQMSHVFVMDVTARVKGIAPGVGACGDAGAD
jgi:hypothetical protein